jgi:uncharacterized protein (TIGR02996 family)
VLDDLLRGIVAEPQAEDRWLVLADWLEEHDNPRRAELLRLHRALLATCCAPGAHPERQDQQRRLVQLLAAGVRPCVPQQTVQLAQGVTMTFSLVPPGAFLMGSPEAEGGLERDEALHRMTLMSAFWLGVYPVTQAQWQAVKEHNPSRFRGAGRPVENVAWRDCKRFCSKAVQKAACRFRLPREVEWEYACRAGTSTPFHFGETISAEQANYRGSHEGRRREGTTPAGNFPPNAFGLFDMHGNVWEWCEDIYETDYQPQGGLGRVIRGGCWSVTAGDCRSARHSGQFERSRADHVGFRVVCVPAAGTP